MLKNPKVTPRALTAKEKADRANDIYDSFANYLCFCHRCSHFRRYTGFPDLKNRIHCHGKTF